MFWLFEKAEMEMPKILKGNEFAKNIGFYRVKA